MSDWLMTFREITFGYPPKKLPVLRDLDLDLRAGRVTAVLGSNGAGKTTLLHLALGWLKPLQGEILLDGKSLGAYNRRELGQWMALVPQGEHVPFEYSVLEYVLLGRAPYLPPLALPTKKDYAASFEALEKAGVTHLYDHSMQRLSSGERQLVLIARALTQQPKLLLLDEPTAHLDLGNKSRLIAVIRELRGQGVTILMTSHEPEVVLAVADEVLLKEMGRALAFGPIDTTLTPENLSRIYQIPIRLVEAGGRKQVLWT